MWWFIFFLEPYCLADITEICTSTSIDFQVEAVAAETVMFLVLWSENEELEYYNLILLSPTREKWCRYNNTNTESALCMEQSL